MVALLDLPTEMLECIFWFLSEWPQGISACRLVCRFLKVLVSPHLFPTIIFAPRTRDIRRLNWILNHDYFSYHVNALFYDASRYDRGTAEQQNQYVTRYRQARRLHQEPSPFHKEEVTTTYRRESYYTAGGLRDNCNRSPDYGTQFSLSCDEGFAEYARRFRFQDRLLEQCPAEDILQRVLSKLPQLRSIYFADYRNLAQREESYHDLCYRLFGNVLEPENLSGNRVCWDTVFPLFDAITQTSQANISAVYFPHSRVEGHPGYRDCFGEESRHRSYGAYPSEPANGLFRPECLGLLCNQQVRGAFSNLARLDISFHPHQTDLPEYFDDWSQFLRAVSGSLEHLKMHCFWFVCGYRYNDNTIHDAHGPTHKIGAYTVQRFNEVLSLQTFTVLRSLELSSWTIDQASLLDFLERHVSTLRKLVLLRNWLIGSSEELAAWIDTTMNLESTNIDNWRDLGHLQDGSLQTKKLVMRQKDRCASRGEAEGTCRQEETSSIDRPIPVA